MQRTATLLSALALIAAVGTGAALASGKSAHNALPDEVTSASVKVPKNTETPADFEKLARVTRQQAEAAALAVQPGQVVQARLDDEDGYLVWQVDVKHAQGTTEIAVDAGNSQVLAAEAEDDDHDDEGHDGHNERG